MAVRALALATAAALTSCVGADAPGHDEPSDFDPVSWSSPDGKADFSGISAVFDRNDIMDGCRVHDRRRRRQRGPGVPRSLAVRHAQLARRRDARRQAVRRRSDRRSRTRSGIDPVVLLARMQVESSLVSATVDAEHEPDRHALGCGCPDASSVLPARTSGLSSQLRCAAEVLAGKLDESQDGTGTVDQGQVAQDRRSANGHAARARDRRALRVHAVGPAGQRRQLVGVERDAQVPQALRRRWYAAPAVTDVALPAFAATFVAGGGRDIDPRGCRICRRSRRRARAARRSGRRRGRPRDRRSRQRAAARARGAARRPREDRRRAARAARRTCARVAPRSSALRRSRSRVSPDPRRRRRPARLRVRRARPRRGRLRLRRGAARARPPARRTRSSASRSSTVRSSSCARAAARTPVEQDVIGKVDERAVAPSTACRSRSIRSAGSTPACSPTCASIAAASRASRAGKRVLNLFSYTGALERRVRARRRGGRDERRHVGRRAGVGAGQLRAREPHRRRVAVRDRRRRALPRRAPRATRSATTSSSIDPPTFSTARGSAVGARSRLSSADRAGRRGDPRRRPAVARGEHPRARLARASSPQGPARAGRTGAIVEQGGLPPEYPTVAAQPHDRYLQICVLRVVVDVRPLHGDATGGPDRGPRGDARSRRAQNEWWKPRFNVAPTQPAPVVTLRDGVRVVEMMRWGLVPFWGTSRARSRR